MTDWGPHTINDDSHTIACPFAMLTSRQILKSMRVALESVGFRLSGTTFHRVNDAHFVEVVNLQSGVRIRAGESAVNLGIFIPEVWVLRAQSESLEQARLITTPKAYDCAIEERLSRIVYEEDRWFDRDDPNVAQTICDLVTSCALPWFGELSSLSAIKGALVANRFHRQVAWGTHAAILKVAGDTEGARSYLAQLRDVDPVNVKVFASSIEIDLSPGSKVASQSPRTRKRF